MTATHQATENECLSTIVEAARLHGWLVMHQRPARTNSGWRTAIEGDAGFPDLTLVRDGRLLFVELKRRGNEPTPLQWQWINALNHAGVEAFVLIVPDQLEYFLATLPRVPKGAA